MNLHRAALDGFDVIPLNPTPEAPPKFNESLEAPQHRSILLNSILRQRSAELFPARKANIARSVEVLSPVGQPLPPPPLKLTKP